MALVLWIPKYAIRVITVLIIAAILAIPPDRITIKAARLSKEPILGPSRNWSEFGLFNPTAIRTGNKTVLLFRAQDRNHVSRIGYATSTDGLHFEVRAEPVLSPETEYEKGGGLEDPRVVQI